MNQISTEICFFKSGSYSNNFELEIARDKDIRIQNYVPIPTNRKKRSKLGKIKKSKVLFSAIEDSSGNIIGVNQESKKEQIKKHLAYKNIN